MSHREELEAYYQILADVKAKTESAIANNLNLEEFIASKPTVKYDPTLGNGFLSPEQFLTIVYGNLSIKKK